MFKFNGKVLQFDQPFVLGEGDAAITYPANWLRLATPADRAEIGIVEFQPDPRPDDKYFFVTDNGDGTYLSVARPLDQVKATLIAEVKEGARARLALTSWYVERLMDPTANDKPIPQEVLDQRAEIRQRADELESEVGACASISELEGVGITWPSSDDLMPA